LRQRVCIDIGDGDTGAFSGKRSRNAAAQSSCRAEHERGLSSNSQIQNSTPKEGQ